MGGQACFQIIYCAWVIFLYARACFTKVRITRYRSLLIFSTLTIFLQVWVFFARKLLADKASLVAAALIPTAYIAILQFLFTPTEQSAKELSPISHDKHDPENAQKYDEIAQDSMMTQIEEIEL